MATQVPGFAVPYPELAAARSRVAQVLRQEEERFFQTIANGMEILEAALADGAVRRLRRGWDFHLR